MTNPVLQKMLKKLAVMESNGPQVNPAVVFEKAVSLAGLNLLGTQIEATSSDSKNLAPAAVIDTLFEHGLNLLIAGENAAFLGLICIDAELINSITDILTGSMADPISETASRAPTMTDAVICGDFINAILREADQIFTKKNPTYVQTGFQISGQESDPSPHLFPDIPHVFLTVTLNIAEGKRGGSFSIAVPSGIWGQKNSDTPIAPPKKPDPAWRAALKQSVIAAPAQLHATLHRKNLSIGEVMKLRVSDIIEIPASALDGMRLESRQSGKSKEVLVAKLGEYQEMRAARVIRLGPANGSQGQKLLTENLG